MFDVFFVPERAASFPRNAVVTGRMHSVVDFAKSNNFIEKRGLKNSTTTSHHMYGGLYGLGRLCVPQADTYRLAEAVQRDFSYGVYSALTENKPYGLPVRFYIDYDFTFSSVEDAKESETLWRHVEEVQQQELSKFFPEQGDMLPFFDCMVLSSGILPTGNLLKPFKAGIHVVYQNIFVSVDMALYITAHIIQRLEKEYRGPGDAGIWAKRIDQNVYAEGRGLRWAWQFKTKKCVRCNGVGYKAACTACEHGEVIDTEASMYAPVYMCRGGGNTEPCRREKIECSRSLPTIDLLMASSIRAVTTREVSRGFTLYAGHLPLPVFKKKHSDTVILACGDTGRASARTEELVPSTDERFSLVTSAIRRIHAEYSSIEIQKIAIKAKGFAIAVLGPGSCFCLNYGKDHNKQRVKFFIGRSYITQSCYCKCDVARPSGVKCKDFMSERFPLTAAEENKLFPKLKRAFSAAPAFAAEASADGSVFKEEPGDSLAFVLTGKTANKQLPKTENTQHYTAKQKYEVYFDGCSKAKAYPQKRKKTFP